MSLWLMIAIIFLAGAIGGIVNALLTDNGFIMPCPERLNGVTIMRPGFVGNILIGAVAAIVSWGFYGPFAASNIFEPQTVILTPSTFTGAILVGIAGAKWLTNEIDKSLLKAAASQAAKAEPSSNAAGEILMASPAQALKITKNMEAKH